MANTAIDGEYIFLIH